MRAENKGGKYQFCVELYNIAYFTFKCLFDIFHNFKSSNARRIQKKFWF